jgi:GntR family transcriptional repressor for pyruvate dehydrogenase complex
LAEGNDVQGEGTDRRSFRPVVDARAHERVVDQITFGIRSGLYEVGEKLPTVAALAEQFQVSKPTISEAIGVLSESGVVESKRGVMGGVTVIKDDIPTSLLGLVPERRQTDIREILEARRAVERELARLACSRAAEDDFARMSESIYKLEEHAGDSHHVRLHYDHLFHYALARAARSDLLAYYQHQILKQLVLVLPEYFYELEDADTVIDLHRRTLDALRRRSERAVDRVIDEHMAVIEQAVGIGPATTGAQPAQAGR